MFMYLCIKAVENVEQKERNFNAPIELSMRDFLNIQHDRIFQKKKKNRKKNIELNY